jgi:hypothetical protein
LRFNVTFAFPTTLIHLGSSEAAAYSSCQFHHLYGGVWGVALRRVLPLLLAPERSYYSEH